MGPRRALSAAIAVLGWVATPAVACERADFERVVEQAALALRDLNLANKPAFQAKLGELKTKRGWSNDQFIERAAPLVQDATIADYDTRSAALLEKLEAGGEKGTSARTPDCALLSELTATLGTLLEVQKAKWAYMMNRVEAELAK